MRNFYFLHLLPSSMPESTRHKSILTDGATCPKSAHYFGIGTSWILSESGE
jgi:hypothetical protein